jgi:energy-converting hydrogenase Eha subunit G
MRFIHLYLIGYFVLVSGAGLALWQAGAFHRLPAIWILISALVVVGLGIVLAVTSVRPTTITRE